MKISVVIPVYNREKTLLDTLTSVRKQIYRPIELILVDNGSKDSSYFICKGFQQQYSSGDFRIIVCQELKKGANAARNKGLSLVTSEYVSFYDSDDEMFPERLQYIAQKIKVTNADIIGTISLIRGKEGNCCIRNNIYSSLVEDQILIGMLSTQNFIVKTELIQNVGGWDESIYRWQDWELGVRLLLHTSNVAWIKDIPLDCVNWHADSITGSTFGDSYSDLISVIDRVIGRIENSNYRNKQCALAYLCYRKIWLAGLLYQEGRLKENIDCLLKLKKELSAQSLRIKILYKFLYQYIKYGGRGAWKIVRILVR